MKLIGEKVVVRPFSEADITAQYISWLNDPVVTRYSNQRFLQHTTESCAAYARSFSLTPNLFVSIFSKATDMPVGTMTAYIAPQHRTADVGILLGEKSVWGQGYGQEAWNLMINWLLTERAMRKVTAGTVAVNAPMLRLLERSAMTFEGRRLRQEIIEGEEVDVLYFGRFSAG